MAAAKRMTKAQIYGELAEKTELSRGQIKAVFEAMKELAKRELKKKEPGEFVIPDMLKLKVRRVPAQKGKKFKNPQTGEEIVRDVPASKKLRATALKKMKEMIL